MKGATYPTVLVVMLLLNIIASTFTIQEVKAGPDIIYVDDDNTLGPWNGTLGNPYQNISSGLEHAIDGDIVFVYNGTYREHVLIDKSISLVGENPLTTVIDGNASEYFPTLEIFNTTNAVVENFTVRNTTSYSEAYGILFYKARNITIQNVVITDAYYGILINNSTQCKVLNNRILKNHNSGIVFRGTSSYNIVVGNLISGNPTGIYIESFSEHNVFYRNNIIDNTLQFNIFPPTYTSWDNGAEGNYWSDYTGTDINGDGVGDTDLPHLGVEYHPLIEPWNHTRTYTVDSYQVVVRCNHTVASFGFNDSMGQISFYITGPTDWSGFCNITVPRGLLNPQPPLGKWVVMLGASPLTYLNESVDSSTLLSLTYTLGASMQDNKVRIRTGTLYPPTASFEFTPENASILEPVNFTDTSTNSPNGTIGWRQWNFGDGQTVNTTEILIEHLFEGKTVFNVTLTVGDNNSLTDSVTIPVRVSNLAPSTEFVFSPTEPSVGLEVSFNASASEDPDGNITEYRWYFGDNTMENTTSATTTHTFEHVGAYNVTLVVIDNDKGEGKTTLIIPVGKGATYINIYIPTSVRVEEFFTINASLIDGAGQSLATQQIVFEIYNSDVTLSKNSVTDSVGIVTAVFSLNTTGEYVVTVEYLGNNDYLVSENITNITVNSLVTAIELSVPENAIQNQEINLSAVLLDESDNPVYNVTVELHILNGSTWEVVDSLQTDQSGVASFSYVPEHTGTFTLKASFNGDEKYAASTSGEHSLVVTAQELDYLPYIILLAAIIATAVLILIVLKRRKNQQNN